MSGLEGGDRARIDAYRQLLRRKCPGVVKRLAIFGSRARGDAHEASDLDILLIARDGDEHRLPELEGAGYLLAADGSSLPGIIPYGESQWGERLRDGFPFQKPVGEEAVGLL